jgi:1,4-dihydroxy-2-naphthoate octaprenyltransferase
VHSKEKVLDFLNSVDIAAIGTSSMGSPRQRMMHYAYDENLNLYLSSMKGDPKVIQWSNVPETAVLIHKGAEFMEMEECEIIGRAVIVKDDKEREKCIDIVGQRSPIVSHMKETGATDRLEFIKIIPYTVKYRFVPEIMQGHPPTVFEFSENKQKSKVWEDVKAKARAWKEATRPLSLTASLIPILLGTSMAFALNDRFNFSLFFLTLLGALFIQAGTNMINDWKDAERDAENRTGIRPFTGGSKMIQMGLISRGDMGFFGILLSLTAFFIGVYLVFMSGLGLVPLILYGLIAGLFYTGGKGKFSFINTATGLAEILIATSYGSFMTLGAYFVQTGTYSITVLLVSLPLSLFITNVLLINQFADAESDEKTDKNTLVVRLGKKQAKNVLIGSFIIGYVLIFIYPFLGITNFSIYIALLSIPFALQAIRYAQKSYNANPFDLIPSNAHTAINHLFTGLMLSLAFLIGVTEIVISLVYFVMSFLFVIWVWNYIERQRKVMNSMKEAFRN